MAGGACWTDWQIHSKVRKCQVLGSKGHLSPSFAPRPPHWRSFRCGCCWARDTGVSPSMVKGWLGVLEDSFLIRMIQPEHRSPQLATRPGRHAGDHRDAADQRTLAGRGAMGPRVGTVRRLVGLRLSANEGRVHQRFVAWHLDVQHAGLESVAAFRSRPGAREGGRFRTDAERGGIGRSAARFP